MPASTDIKLINQIAIKIDGSDLSLDIMEQVISVEVDSSLDMPSMFIMRFYDNELTLVDNANLFKPGKAVDISLAGMGQTSVQSVITGEITAVEPEFAEDLTAILTVRGYDKSHRLSRGTKTRTFVDSKDSDAISKVIQEAGLSGEVTATSAVHKHLFQDNLSDREFIHFLARRNGLEVVFTDGKVKVRAPTAGSPVATLQWGKGLRSFRPRLTLANQVNQVTVKGWDPVQKTAITGIATSSTAHPTTGITPIAGAAAQQAFGAKTHVEVRRPVSTQAEAEKLAKALLDQFDSDFLEAEGVAFGNSVIVAGAALKLEKLGTRFSGTYRVTSATHVYSAESYDTTFKVEGARPDTMADLIQASSPDGGEASPWGGVVIGIVTNNNDSEGNQWRVKVKFPWLDDSMESGWARVCSPDAGNGRGMMWLPEVNDEVLVAFEYGDFNRPYVLGTLWNGKDAPLETIGNTVKNGKVVARAIKSRTGHIIRMTEDDSNSKIEIIDAKTQTSVTMDGQNKKITIDCKGDIDMTGTGTITIKGNAVNIESTTGAVDVKSKTTLGMQGQTGVTLKSQATMAVEAQATLDLKANGPATLQSSAITQVKGSLVKIN